MNALLSLQPYLNSRKNTLNKIANEHKKTINKVILSPDRCIL